MSEVFGLNEEAWNKWLKYRKDIKKPLKPASFELAQKKLASFGNRQMDAVDNSIANGWTGLFPPPKEKAVFKQQQDTARQDRDFQEFASRAKRVGFRAPFQGEDLIGYKTLVERAEHQHAMNRPKGNGPATVSELFKRFA
jgi:hypothetical protein